MLQFGHSDWMLWNGASGRPGCLSSTRASIRPQRLDAVESRRPHGECGDGDGALQFGHSDWMLWNFRLRISLCKVYASLQFGHSDWMLWNSSPAFHSLACPATLQFGHSDWMLWNGVLPFNVSPVTTSLQFGHSDWMLWNVNISVKK